MADRCPRCDRAECRMPDIDTKILDDRQRKRIRDEHWPACWANPVDWRARAQILAASLHDAADIIDSLCDWKSIDAPRLRAIAGPRTDTPTASPAPSPPSLAPLRARAEALLAVADKATPGPWRAGDGTGGWPGSACGPTHVMAWNAPNDEPGESHEWTAITANDNFPDAGLANVAAIVALHNDAPALIRDLLAALAGKDGAA